jgi:hypothetical protein
LYCNSDPVNNIDPTGHAGQKVNGIVGWGIQVALSAQIGSITGFVGMEFVWFAFNNTKNFGQGLIPSVYFFAGGNLGITSDLKKVDLKKYFTKNFFNNPTASLKNFKLNFSFSVSITFFLVKGINFRDRIYYTGSCTYKAVTIAGYTASKSTGQFAKTYGVGRTWEIGFSNGRLSPGRKLYGACSGGAYYWLLGKNKNGQNLYSYVK